MKKALSLYLLVFAALILGVYGYTYAAAKEQRMDTTDFFRYKVQAVKSLPDSDHPTVRLAPTSSKAEDYVYSEEDARESYKFSFLRKPLSLSPCIPAFVSHISEKSFTTSTRFLSICLNQAEHVVPKYIVLRNIRI